MCKYRQELTSTGDVITTVFQNPGAIGYASVASVKDSVIAVTVGSDYRRMCVVDNYFLEAKRDIISLVAENPEKGEFALDILMIAKYLERIGDHATNIAEWVIYCITGMHEEV